MKLSRNRNRLYQGNSQENSSDGYSRSSVGLFRVILHSLLCVAAFVLGFRLSGEARIVINSLKPSRSTFFPDSITRLYKARGFHELSIWAPYVRDDRNYFTPTLPSGLPPSTGVKSSRVHVGRHEILIRPWPYPDPLQTMVAHRLIKLVQNEQVRVHGLQERKRLLVITPTYVHALQVVHVSSLIHTLRIIPGPLTWIVVEAGGISSETEELLSSSQLSFHHIGIQEQLHADWDRRKHLEKFLRFKGLSFIREQRLDGIVVFLDDSSTYSLEFFNEAQKVDWIGAFSVGLLFCSGKLDFSNETRDLSDDDSTASMGRKIAELGVNFSSVADELSIRTSYRNFSASKEDFRFRPILPLQGPVCNTEGQVVGWYHPFKDAQKQDTTRSRGPKWVGFALNAKILWEDSTKPTWIKSWNEVFGVNQSLPESPLDFLKESSFVEPLGNCGRDVMIWSLQLEADVGIKFPSWYGF